MAIIESEMISHPQHVLSSIEKQPKILCLGKGSCALKRNTISALKTQTPFMGT